MAINQTATKVDGQYYEAGKDAPDLGSFMCVQKEGSKRLYWGLSKDVSKLPHYVVTGSRALCLDTGDTYYFFEGTDEWYKLSIAREFMA